MEALQKEEIKVEEEWTKFNTVLENLLRRAFRTLANKAKEEGREGKAEEWKERAEAKGNKGRVGEHGRKKV